MIREMPIIHPGISEMPVVRERDKQMDSMATAQLISQTKQLDTVTIKRTAPHLVILGQE